MCYYGNSRKFTRKYRAAKILECLKFAGTFFRTRVCIYEIPSHGTGGYMQSLYFVQCLMPNTVCINLLPYIIQLYISYYPTL